MFSRILSTADGKEFTLYHYPAENTKAYVHLLHGLAEHCQRYHVFAEFLQQHGYYVLSHNHRGHGERLPHGHFADQRGWEKVLDDISLIHQELDQGIPLVLFGHSMGSFIAQAYAIIAGKRLQGLVLSGSNYQSPLMYYGGISVATLLKRLRPKLHGSRVLAALTTGAFNRHFKPAKTTADWLSRDHQTAQAYLDDPLCGFNATPGFWRDFFYGLIQISKHSELEKIPANLPIYIFSGEHDPVGQQGKGVRALLKAFEQTRHKNVSLKLYPQGRHEMLNEINKDEVYQDCLSWLDQNISVNRH